ncbi:hypothetical protein FOL47_001225 [Perkinsus chesapeaki]|uniref:TIR domain-containing protein n=1 Tax=Perkinsus chesapeaki TaxID=330153 RepID=A0A7J6MJL2_PERCH|nr:hypothetical protein FOL47_001225 [Perkinsus chesapeaki]
MDFITSSERPVFGSHIRGTTLDNITSRCYLFYNSEASEKTYELSRQVEKLDLFLSHSWSGSPFWKHMTLVTVLYVKFGYIAMLLTVIPLSVGIYFLPAYKREAVVATEVLGVFAMFLGMWFGYLVPSRTNKKMVFLDKCCIPQVDEEAKREGLKNMEAYLSRSDTLLILWTPEYFSRLWCVFELASYLRSHGPDSILCLSAWFMRSYHMVVWWEVACVISLETANAAIPRDPQIKLWIALVCWSVTEVALCIAICLIVILFCIPAKMELKKQVQQFSMRTAYCTLAEDTTMLSSRISEWYGSNESFDECVRSSWSRVNSVMKIPEPALSRPGIAFVTFPYVMALWPRLLTALAWNYRSEENGYSWTVIIRSTFIMFVLLACRTPLFVVMSYRIGSAVWLKGSLAKCISIAIMVFFALLYGGAMFVSAQGVLILYGPQTPILFAQSPWAWLFIALPILAVALVCWTHFPRGLHH